MPTDCISSAVETPSMPYLDTAEPSPRCSEPPAYSTPAPPRVELLGSPPRSPATKESSIIAKPSPKTKHALMTNPTPVKPTPIQAFSTPKRPHQARGRRIEGERRGKGRGKMKIRGKPDMGRPNILRKRTTIELIPCVVKRKGTTVVDLVDVKEPIDRKHKKSRQALMPTFLRE